MKTGLIQFRQTFVQESADNIDSMETGLLRLRSAPNDAELLNSIFRSAHSIKVEAGSGLVNRSGETLHAIVGSVRKVTEIVGEIAAASGEQTAGIEQVNGAMTQMDQVTQANSAQTEDQLAGRPSNKSMRRSMQP
jgi:methyl-accepting chemotaxis protein